MDAFEEAIGNGMSKKRERAERDERAENIARQERFRLWDAIFSSAIREFEKHNSFLMGHVFADPVSLGERQDHYSIACHLDTIYLKIDGERILPIFVEVNLDHVTDDGSWLCRYKVLRLGHEYFQMDRLTEALAAAREAFEKRDEDAKAAITERREAIAAAKVLDRERVERALVNETADDLPFGDQPGGGESGYNPTPDEVALLKALGEYIDSRESF